jgi:S1 RNA binding domain protein
MQLEVGMILEGKITGITKFGVFVDLPEGKTGMVHISEVASTYVKEIKDFVSENQVVKVKILNITEDGKISLSMKRAAPEVKREPSSGNFPPRRNNSDWNGHKSNEPATFEDMLTKFKQSSEERMLDLKRVTESKRGGGSRRSK